MPFDLDQIKKFPTSPGVYIMKDRRGQVLYVGKANNLRSRVRQYFVPKGDSRPQIPYLIAKVATIDTVVVTSEKEALLLENTLIKEHQPRYNVFLKDDKSYISLMLTKHKWPMIRLVRYKGKPKEDGQYFGPYTSAYAARETFELLTRYFPLRRCSDRELESRTRPCILYQIKRCVAPCVGHCTQEEYQQIVERAVAVLKGKDQEVVASLRAEMDEAAAALEFERAGELQRTIAFLERTVEQQMVDQAGSGDRDILGIYREGGEVSLSQMLFREGKLIGAQNYAFSSVIQDDPELLSSFILQHYAEEPTLPHEIVLRHPLAEADTLAALISEGKRRRVHFVIPQRGDKRALLAMAEANAHAAFHREQDETRLGEKRLMALQEQLKLNNYPRRIECFDNSALGGTEPVAAMVAFTDGEKDRSRYRKYKLTAAAGQDDYEAMREVLSRRLKRGQKEQDLPDLIVVDGGKGQLNIARALLDQLNIVTVDAIGLAKEQGRHTKGLTAEQIFLPGAKDPLLLSPHSEVLFLLQKIRDEAHRFALEFQKKRRSKRLIRTALDDIPGIGPVKRNRLMRHFGSLKRILEASDEDLLGVKGITRADVKALRTHRDQR